MNKAKTGQNGLTSENLKNALWETLQAVRTKKMDPSVGNAVATQARGILSTVKLELMVQKLLGQKPSGSATKFLVGPQQNQ